PGEGPLGSHDFTGGVATVVARMRALGFEVEDLKSQSPQRLRRGAIYSWEELGRTFDFRPAYLSVAGGMISRPDHDAVLVISHPGPTARTEGERTLQRLARSRKKRAAATTAY